MTTTSTVLGLRKRLGVSQLELAEKLGVGVRTVGRLEAAEQQGQVTKHLARAQSALGQIERSRQARGRRAVRTVAALREQLRASQPALARLLGVSTKTLQRWESEGMVLGASQGPAGSRSTYAIMVLARLKERLQEGNLEELQAIVALAEQDLKGAMARLMGDERRAS